MVGVDGDQAMVAAAVASGLKATRVDARELYFDNEFDVVFSNAVLHWVPDKPAVVAGVKRALKPGGRFFGEFGGSGCVQQIREAMAQAVGEVTNKRWQHPWQFCCADEFKAVLEDAGFMVESISWFRRYPVLPNGLRGWLETFVFELNDLTEKQREQIFQRVEALLADSLLDKDGNWHADYVRLRFDTVLP